MKYDAHLITERLHLRPLTRTDAADLFLMYRNEQAMQYMDTPPHKTVAETEEKIEALLTENATW
ncbi:MAG: GNAT family N-acetyltransferase [Chloroflexi bacterium]|nr:GNAT family N-acetyltransferase [Chloroflexota bacterium]